MKIIGHTVISLIAGSILYKLTHSFTVFLWVLTLGIFIDLDHYIDYVREKGVSFNLKKIYFTCKNGSTYFKKLFLVLHSHELIVILWLVIFMFDLDVVWRCAALSISLHLLVDQIVNPVVPMGYFFLFRLTNNFKTNKTFLTKEVNHAHRNRKPLV